MQWANREAFHFTEFGDCVLAGCRLDLFTRDAQGFYRAFGFAAHKDECLVRYPPSYAGGSPGVGGATMLAGVLLHLAESHGHVHAHGALEHEHAHTHDDGHHIHQHYPMPAAAHSHTHRHDALQHAHSHVPDAHHAHRH
jgi:hypothetical protein